MGKIIGIVLLLGGISGSLYQWMQMQKERQKRVEEFGLFLHKSIFAMETERIKVIAYFAKYKGEDSKLTDALQEISRRLRENIYPNGQMVWEEVLKEAKESWNLDKETFDIVLKSGIGFFGFSREENICFLKKQMEELEKRKKINKESDAKERKVWVPVSLLGGIMFVIMCL